MSRIYDGTFTTAQQNGPTVVKIDPNTRSLIYEHKMIQTAEDWAPIALDTQNSANAFLVFESDPQATDCGLVEWTRIYANVPNSRDEYGEYVYPIQFAISTEGEVFEIAVKMTARFHYDYFHTAVPSGVEILHASKIGASAGITYVLYPPFPTQGTERVAEDSTLKRWQWQCNIWERMTIYVTPPLLENLV